MIVKCAWCGKVEGEKEPLDDRRVTHTICPTCFAKSGVKTGEVTRESLKGVHLSTPNASRKEKWNDT